MDFDDLPNSWKLVELNIVIKEIYRYPNFYGMEHLNQGVPVIRGEHINSNGSISHDWDNYWFIPEELSLNFPKTILQLNDLVMSVRGSIGKIGIIDEKLVNAQLSPNCIKLSFHKNYCFSKFYLHYLKSSNGYNSIQLVTNATTIQTIKSSSLSKILVPLPPFNEQKRIVEKIELIQERTRKVKSELDNIKVKLKRLR